MSRMVGGIMWKTSLQPSASTYGFLKYVFVSYHRFNSNMNLILCVIILNTTLKPQKLKRFVPKFRAKMMSNFLQSLTSIVISSINTQNPNFGFQESDDISRLKECLVKYFIRAALADTDPGLVTQVLNPNEVSVYSYIILLCTYMM